MDIYETVTIERSEGVATLTLNRPEAANTLSRQLAADLLAATDELREDPSVQVVVLTGSGDRHFCGGADLRDLADVVAGETPADQPERDFISEIERLPQPVVAAINGAAMGGGCELALACDFRIMSSEAQIGLTEIAFGALPAGGGTQRLPRLIGVAKAKELIMLGRRLSAAEALTIGLVSEVVAPDQLRERAHAFAGELAQSASYALAAAKQAINQGANMTLVEGLRLEQQVVQTMATPAERQAAIERAMAKSETYRNIFSGGRR